MLIIAATGYRRWLARPWQWTMRDYLVVVAACAAGLLVSRFPTPMVVFFTGFAGAVLGCLILAGYGFRLTDIVTLLAIVLLTGAFLLPAMDWTRSRTLGRRTFPFAVPARYSILLFGAE